MTEPDADRYRRALAFLDSLVLARPRPHYIAARRGRAGEEGPAFGLARLRALLEALGRPQDRLRFVHITGTSGKTSTALFAAGLQRCVGGGPVGLHISPHMSSPRERLTVDGQPCSRAELTGLVEEVKPILDAEYRRGEHGMASYFEVLLALALHHFARRGVDVAVLEAGLGGRYDGSNVIGPPEVCVITNIGLDHTHILGDTRADIARDKVGIVKPGAPLITAEQDPAILAIFEQACAEAGSKLEVLGRDFHVEARGSDPEGCRFAYRSPSLNWREARVGAPGDFQAANAALALRATELTAARSGRPELAPAALAGALAALKPPGRFEVMRREPPVILDGAHNPEKMQGLVSSARRMFPELPFVAVVAATSGRDLPELLRPLIGWARVIAFTRSLAPHRVDEEPWVLRETALALASEAGLELEASLWLDPADAFAAASRRATEEGLGLCVTGSLYLVAHLRSGFSQG